MVVESFVEKNAGETESLWQKLLPKILIHKQDLLDWNVKMVDEYDAWGPEQKTVEKNAFIALMEMTPEQVGQLVKNYYIATRDPLNRYGLWNQTIEAQIHYINNIADFVREKNW